MTPKETKQVIKMVRPNHQNSARWSLKS
jgi:hypothetical protein